MEKIEIQSTSQHSAICSDVVLRETDNIRLVFRPQIVDNPHNVAACVNGTFIYQKKGKKDQWEDAPKSSLASLKKGEGYQLEIHAGELHGLLIQLGRLYRLYRKTGGVPQGRQEYVRIEESLAKLLQLTEPDLQEFVESHAEDAAQTLHKVLGILSRTTALAKFVEADAGEINLLSALVGIASLRAVMRVWEENADNSDEEFWQRTIAEHAVVFSVLFAYPVVIVKEKAYVGGKTIENLHGNLVDFLARAESSGNALLIEIKTPGTPLLGREYRDGVYPPSREFGGALAQVLNYRDSLMKEIHALNAAQTTSLLGAEPRCLVVIGNSSTELASETTRSSFERFRERLQGVTVLTFDELFGRIAQLERLLSST